MFDVVNLKIDAPTKEAASLAGPNAHAMMPARKKLHFNISQIPSALGWGWPETGRARRIYLRSISDPARRPKLRACNPKLPADNDSNFSRSPGQFFNGFPKAERCSDVDVIKNVCERIRSD
jgi:hypothetical protein